MNIFSKDHWSANSRSHLRKLAIAGVICALCVAMSGLYIPLSNSLQIQFTFIVVALGCAVYGPITGMAVAAVVDLISYFLFLSAYPYFPGYMLSEMLAALVFGLFLYQRKITVYKLFWSRVLINFPINVALGALWSKILYGKGYIADLWIRAVKNTLLLPLEVLLMSAVFGLMIPFLSRMKLLPAHHEEDLQKLQLGAGIFPVFALSCLLGGICSTYYAFMAETRTWVFYLLGGLLLGGSIALAVIGIVLKKRSKA